MNSRERLKTALNHRQPDRVCVDFGGTYARIFTEDGICTMLAGDKVNWRKPFKVISPTRVMVEGAGEHDIKPDGTLNIEGRYTAHRRNHETAK